jgi:hypothetical protein
VGAPISVLYTPGEPARSFPKQDPPRLAPPSLAWVIMPMVTGLGILPLIAIIQARRYLAHGKATMARITIVQWRAGTPATVWYQFPLDDGTSREDSYTTGKVPPAEGSSIPVLYDPKDPRRNTRYPVSLVTLAAD